MASTPSRAGFVDSSLPKIGVSRPGAGSPAYTRDDRPRHDGLAHRNDSAPKPSRTGCARPPELRRHCRRRSRSCFGRLPVSLNGDRRLLILVRNSASALCRRDPGKKSWGDRQGHCKNETEQSVNPSERPRQAEAMHRLRRDLDRRGASPGASGIRSTCPKRRKARNPPTSLRRRGAGRPRASAVFVPGFAPEGGVPLTSGVRRSWAGSNRCRTDKRCGRAQ